MNIKIKVTVIVSASLFIAAGIFLAWKNFSHTSSMTQAPKQVNTVNYSPPTKAQKQAGDQAKANAANTGSSNESSLTQAVNGTITISRIDQSAGSDTVSLRTIVTNLTSGTCIATFSKTGGSTLVEHSDIVNSATYYSCSPIDISTNQFSISGTWNVSVQAVNAQDTAISNTITATVQVQK